MVSRANKFNIVEKLFDVIDKIKNIDKRKAAMWILFWPILGFISSWKKNRLGRTAVVLLIIALMLSALSLYMEIVEEEVARQEISLNEIKVDVENHEYEEAKVQLENLLKSRVNSEHKKEASALLNSVSAEIDRIKAEEAAKKAKEEEEKKKAEAAAQDEKQRQLDAHSVDLLLCTGVSVNDANEILNNLKSVGINYITQCADAGDTGIQGVKTYNIKFESKICKLTLNYNKTMYISYGENLYDSTKGGVIKNIND